MEAFRSTLEEVARSTLIVHVADASSPDVIEQIDAVREVLAEIGAVHIPEVLALNKIDRLSETERARAVARIDGDAVPISALTGSELDELAERIERSLPLPDGRRSWSRGAGGRDGDALPQRGGPLRRGPGRDPRARPEWESASSRSSPRSNMQRP